jgi:hypothetical protein
MAWELFKRKTPWSPRRHHRATPMRLRYWKLRNREMLIQRERGSSSAEISRAYRISIARVNQILARERQRITREERWGSLKTREV